MHAAKSAAKSSANKLFLRIIWLLEGAVVGFGAILPGVSGGTLCVAFGMYRPMIETLNSPKKKLRRHGLMLGLFLAGAAVGFIGLSGLAAMLLERNTALVTCAFIGFILGTLPELWQDAGKEGRTKRSLAAMVVCFAGMLGVLALLKTNISMTIAPGIPGFMLCGLLWGLSFIVPGLSSSSLLLFFGLYQPMLEGISSLDVSVLLPMGAGMLGCVLLLSKAVGFAYKRHYSAVSHAVLGIVAATAVMIFPKPDESPSGLALSVLAILAGAAVSFMLTCGCNRLKKDRS